jgi:uroporphyrinogen III methyltransferase/synthase
MNNEQNISALKTVGKVYLVGAGPGDPKLITVRGLETLQSCDAVVYDRLVSLELIAALPPQVQRYFVGKASGYHTLEQDQINELLTRLALEGLTVVRLKGGDPFVFGRGGEEALHLKRHGIPYELVPGITAGLAAGAFTGIPVTHRGKSGFLTIITAHEAANNQECQVPWEWLAQGRDGTLIGYMGVTQLPQVVSRLLAGGMDPETPAAMIERGATALQRTVKGALKDLPMLVQKARITPPALFIIGEVVSLHDELGWVQTGSLSGKKVMVTRPSSQAEELYNLLRGHGAYIMPFPTLAIQDYEDLILWDQLTPLLQQWETRPRHWLVFSSENGVQHFMIQFKKRHDLRKLSNFRIGVIGIGTLRMLRFLGFNPDLVPDPLTTAGLVRELPGYLGSGVQVIRVRGNQGDDRIELAVRAAGANVHSLQVYSTKTAVWDEGLKTHLRLEQPDIIMFTSGATLTGLVEIMGLEAARELASKSVVASIGPTTSGVIMESGIEVTVEADEHSVPGLVQSLVSFYNSKKP